MSQSFIDYLDEYENRLEAPVVRRPPAFPKAQPKTSTKIVENVKVVPKKVEQPKTLSVCQRCGWNTNTLLEGCQYCPKCGQRSLTIASNKGVIVNKPKVNESVDYANSLLDDNDTSERPSMLEGLLRQTQKIPQVLQRQTVSETYQPSRSSRIADDASDLLDGIPDPIQFIPMPDFSQFMPKPIQESVQMPSVPELPKIELLSPQPISPDVQRQMEQLGLS